MLFRILFSTLLALTALVPQGTAQDFDPANLPFAPGERLEYVLRWENIPAGSASLQVHDIEFIDGQPSLHFRMLVSTNSFVDVFYKVRDVIDSYAALDMSRSLLFVQDQNEGDVERDIRVEFDWTEMIAKRISSGVHKDTVAIFPDTFDELSVGYFQRLVELRPGEIIEAHVTDGNNCVLGRATCLGREWISVPAGDYYCFVIRPETKDLGGVFEKSPDAEILAWITADERRMPVRIRSEVIVGHFTADLVSATPGQWGEVPVQAPASEDEIDTENQPGDSPSP
ncbi:MAG: DUF3108 domain-containing protein [Desulfovibrio sp.]|mgnify:FL=1|nr:MAG: DUF3108 domain-containing protein [Desulfovibrio sp.]